MSQNEIYLLEQNKALRHILNSVLTRHRYNVTTLQEVDHFFHEQARQPAGIFLLDFDNFTTYQEYDTFVRVVNPSTSLIFSTSRVETYDKLRFLHPTTPVLLKPFELHELLDALYLIKFPPAANPAAWESVLV